MSIPSVFDRIARLDDSRNGFLIEADNVLYELLKLLAPSSQLRYGPGMASDSNALTILREPGGISVGSIPQLIADARPGARFAWDEFFGGMIRNRHTRDA